MRLMQSWQLRDESERDTRFPQACSAHAVGLGLGVCSLIQCAALCDRTRSHMWCHTATLRETHFPQDLADARIAVLTAGQSLLLPSGWIHAVFTPCDSCAVLGWNRLQPCVLEAAALCAGGCTPVLEAASSNWTFPGYHPHQVRPRLELDAARAARHGAAHRAQLMGPQDARAAPAG